MIKKFLKLLFLNWGKVDTLTLFWIFLVKLNLKLFVFCLEMPRKYTRKTDMTNNYSEESLLQAVNEIQNGMPLLTAAKEFGIPRSTLRRKHEKMG
jgi:DNA-binding protein Fis